MGSIQEMGNVFDAMAENTVRKHRRADALKVVGVGGLLVILGVGLRASTTT